MNEGLDEVRNFWDRVAEDWRTQVGRDGDENRRLNSDPVLWRFAGDVGGLKVLDAGCGTGYLSLKLAERGARVTGVDLSERMIAIAAAAGSGVDFRVDSCSQLATLADGEFDMVISNYVLMDTPDLKETMSAFHRVLKPEGLAILVLSHPCFPAGRATISEDGDRIVYSWDFPYFQTGKRTDPPWSHFTSEFIWFHRPLSDYWKAFHAAGFQVVDFEEPRLAEDRYHLAATRRALKRNQGCPYSVAFKLRRKR